MKAFSLIELIFVVIIMGILTVVGVSFLPNETPLSDTQVLKKIILTKKTNALGYKVFTENNDTCLKVTQDYLNSEENQSKVKYRFKSSISVNGLNSDSLLCFDYLGRPYDGVVEKNLSNILSKNVTITLSFHNKEKNLTLFPISGYIR